MKVGIISAGIVGGGIAQVFARVDGYEVYLCDLIDAFAEGGKERIGKGLTRRVAKGKLSQEGTDKILGCIHTGTRDIYKDCDLVIETAIGNMQIKKQTFEELSEIYKKGYLFTTGTSSLSITKISAGPDRPVAGMHLFNPAPVIKLVEVISGLDTPQKDLDRTTKVARGIGKTVVPIRELAGLAVNRILIPVVNEAVGVYADNSVPAEKTNEAVKLDANHSMGPLAPGNLIGLDVVLTIMEMLQSETGDTKYRPHPKPREMVRDSRLGRKTGRGFYDYTK